MSVLQKSYELARSRKQYMRAIREAKLEFRLLVKLSRLIQGDVNNATTNIMICSDARLTGGEPLNCPFKRFYESQRSLVSSAYYALKHGVNVPDFAWKLISKWR